MDLQTKNLCIYSKADDRTATFKAGEHIIPAAIGGKKKLPCGYVSDQMNNHFSKMEEDFMRRSHLGIMRAMHGPGKRGSKSINKRTASQVTLVKNEKPKQVIGLAQMILGEVALISQIHVKVNSKYTFMSNHEKQSMENLNVFTSELLQFQFRYQKIKDDDIPPDEYYLGYVIEDKKVKWYLSSSVPISEDILKEQIERWIENQHNLVIGQIESFEPQMGFEYRMNTTDVLRVCAKIVFNYLAEVKGQDFALLPEFDKLRMWIVNGGGKVQAHPTDPSGVPELFSRMNIAERAHTILISKVDNQLIGVLYLYGGFINTVVMLSDEFYRDFGELEGFVCDWENEAEMPFAEFLGKNSK